MEKTIKVLEYQGFNIYISIFILINLYFNVGVYKIWN